MLLPIFNPVTADESVGRDDFGVLEAMANALTAQGDSGRLRLRLQGRHDGIRRDSARGEQIRDRQLRIGDDQRPDRAAAPGARGAAQGAGREPRARAPEAARGRAQEARGAQEEAPHLPEVDGVAHPVPGRPAARHGPGDDASGAHHGDTTPGGGGTLGSVGTRAYHRPDPPLFRSGHAPPSSCKEDKRVA